MTAQFVKLVSHFFLKASSKFGQRQQISVIFFSEFIINWSLTRRQYDVHRRIITRTTSEHCQFKRRNASNFFCGSVLFGSLGCTILANSGKQIFRLNKILSNNQLNI
jgi:hypothetical protein